LADGEPLASQDEPPVRNQARWKRDAVVGGLVGLMALGMSFKLLGSSAMGNGAALPALVLGTVPGIGIGNGVGLLIMIFTSFIPAQEVMGVLWSVCNAGAYALTWVVFRRPRGNARMVKTIVLVSWAIWFGIAFLIASSARWD
jgi:hypothetical protein